MYLLKKIKEWGDYLLAKIGLRVRVIRFDMRISFTLFLIVTSVIPETEDMSLCRTVCPNRIEPIYK